MTALSRLSRSPVVHVLLGLLCIGPFAGGTAQAQQARSLGDSIFAQLGQRGLDVQHYDLRLKILQPGRADLSGDVTLTLRATEPLGEVQLDLRGPQVKAAQWNAQAVPWTQGNGKVTVKLPRPLRTGETGRLRLIYDGMGRQAGEQRAPLRPGWQVTGAGGLSYSLSEPDGTHGFLPSNDHPSDPATFTVRVTVPAGFSAAASGLLTSEKTETNGLKTLTFTQRSPIPTYALALVAGPLERRVLPEVQLGTQTVRRRDVYAAGLETSEVPPGETEEMLRVLASWFGPYPGEVYGVAVLPVPPPALETATLTTLPAASNREEVRLHELAHQWFGNRITLGDWADTWLNEGFATYAELLWAESQGQDGQALAAEWHARLQGQSSRPLRAVNEAQLFDAAAYRRGALALHALRLEVGDDRFRRFLPAYAAAFATRPTSTSAFLEFVRAQLGAQAAATLRTWVEAEELPPLPTPRSPRP